MTQATTDLNISYALRTQVGAVCIALITAGAFVSVPLPGSPVPIVLQNMFVIITGLIMTPLWALLATGTYLLLGALGLPVFAGATGGFAHFAGPTGGFLLSYLPAAALTSWLVRVGRGRDSSAHDASMIRKVLALLAGFSLIHLVGLPWLAMVLEMPLTRAFWIGTAPFIPGDLLKAGAVIILLRSLPSSLWRSWS
ncbi:biotin transport system substrate-specific component [Alkalispirochaeta americana]|uniref:Biotin transporter n=1 Tax=Alkalispirochaeta americana TaxID=159291 RepID=A0A1N6NZQ8_9SPIO|nr:biotin transporter BioY [Alkalispirochaeta americana]SIP97559.1 biotin transport system substrate-specific component [Alkalispirochaeta americana]